MLLQIATGVSGSIKRIKKPVVNNRAEASTK